PVLDLCRRSGPSVLPVPPPTPLVAGLSKDGGRTRHGLLLLAGDRLGLALAGACVGVGALAADGEALAVAQAAVAGEVHQPLDVHRRVAPEVSLDRVIGVDRLADLQHFGVGQVLHTAGMIDAELVGDLTGGRRTDSVDIGKRNNKALAGRDIYPSNTSHLILHAPQGLASRVAGAPI